MYYAIGASVSSLHRESTDSLIHVHIYMYVLPSCVVIVCSWMYRRTGFDCEYLLNANCEFFYDSQ